MIRIQQLTKCFNGKPAVKSLDLEIASGEIFCFLGPNGAGKTTTIKMLVGLLQPTSGVITICGHDVQEESLKARGRIAYIPDEPYLYEKLTGREFLRFVGELFELADADIEQRSQQMIDTFSLGDFIDQLCEGYSHGMKQRVVLASALLHRPEVLVVDEPMVGLDPKSARLVKDLFRREAARGAALFISTHSLEVAEVVADRIGIINHGQRVALGTMAELRQTRDASARLEEIFLEITEGV